MKKLLIQNRVHAISWKKNHESFPIISRFPCSIFPVKSRNFGSPLWQYKVSAYCLPAIELPASPELSGRECMYSALQFLPLFAEVPKFGTWEICGQQWPQSRKDTEYHYSLHQNTISLHQNIISLHQNTISLHQNTIIASTRISL